MEAGRRTTLRSDFLVHWTGAKDIEKEYKKGKSIVREDKTLSDEERKEKYKMLCKERRRKYVKRFHDTLEPIGLEDPRANGLWMTRMQEKIPLRKPRDRSLKYDVPVTCFTEIKLSDIRDHTMRYGCLGLGFSRSFVIRRFGAPVQYVAGTEDDIIAENLNHVYGVLGRLKSCCAHQELQKSGIIEHLKKSGVIDREINDIFEDLLESVKTNICFIKNMSESDHLFSSLDEAEWRIPYTEIKANAGMLTLIKRGHRPESKIPFGPNDLKVLIFPDAKARQMALEDCDIRKWLFKDPKYLPIIATVEECAQF